MATHTYNYASSAKTWASELAIVFGAGFAVATVLWLGLWFLAARPAQASVLEAQGAELQQSQAALAQCQTSVQLLTEDKEMLEAEIKQLDTMLKNAWAASARRNQAKQGADKPELKAEN